MASIPFSDTTNKNGIIQLVEFNAGLGDGGISGNSTLLKQVTALVNIASSEVWHLLFRSNQGWKYDDSNNTDLPQATQTLQAGVSKYSLPTGVMGVDRIEIMDNTGNYRRVTAITQDTLGNRGIDEFYKTDGFPRYYRLIGSSIELFPAPATANVTTVAGLKVYFDRGSSTFVSTDTTKTPGFASEYHDLIPTKTSVKVLQILKPDSSSLISLKGDEARREGQVSEYEQLKFKDRKPIRMTARFRNPR
jgi:hypothetical protein